MKHRYGLEHLSKRQEALKVTYYSKIFSLELMLQLISGTIIKNGKALYRQKHFSKYVPKTLLL